MAKIQLTLKRRLELLQNLLLAEQDERQSVARIFHSKKNELLELSYPLARLGSSSANSTDVKEIKKIVEIFLKDARTISKTIFPAIVFSQDILYGLRQLRNDLEERFKNIDLEILSDTTEFKDVDKIKQLGAYKICASIIEYLVLTNHSEIAVSVFIEKGYFEIFVLGILARKQKGKPHHDVENSLKIIQGRLVLEDAKILPETDWIRSFKFRINVK